MARRKRNRSVVASEISFSRRGLETLFRLALAYGLIAFLFLLNLTALPIPYAGLVKPHLFLMVVYYWAIFMPRLLPTWLCFVAGILLDILSGMPTGLQAFILVIVQSLVRDQRKFLMAQPYISLWAIFGFVVALAAAIQWCMFGLANNFEWLPLMPAAVSALVTFCLFPLVTMGLIAIHRLLSPAQAGYP